jgi:NADPH2:quinone reductase
MEKILENVVPKEGKVIRVNEFKNYSEGMKLEMEPVPIPGEGEALIQVVAAPIAQLDLLKADGLIPTCKVPYTPGLEGSGVVIIANTEKGLELSGKKVSFFAPQGSMRQYVTVKAHTLIVHEENVDLLQASMAVANPLTAIGLIDQVEKHGAKAFIQTGANSATGKIIYRIAKDRGYEVINVIRSDKSAEEMKQIGAEHILNFTDNGFADNLKELATKLNATVCIDALAGDIVGKLVKSLPPGGVYINYGTLTKEPIGGIDSAEMRHTDKTIKTFLMPRWLMKADKLAMLKYQAYIKDNLTTIFVQEVGTYGVMWDFSTHFQNFKNNPSKRTVLTANL